MKHSSRIRSSNLLFLFILIASTIQILVQFHYMTEYRHYNTITRRVNVPFERFRNDFLKENGVLPAIQNLDRIYYINMDRRTDKRDFMESWLKPFSKQYSIPYQRISARTSDKSCGEITDDELMRNCHAKKGLRNSNLYIMDHYNITGYTLVVEDDYQITNYTRLLNSVKKVPEDWDVIRFDCWVGKKSLNPGLDFPQFELGFRTVTPHDEKGFCGGTHAVLWRSDRLDILRKVWDYPKFGNRGIDCLLSNDDIKSYCVQMNIGHLHRRDFVSDIPKLNRRGKTPVHLKEDDDDDD